MLLLVSSLTIDVVAYANEKSQESEEGNKGGQKSVSESIEPIKKEEVQKEASSSSPDKIVKQKEKTLRQTSEATEGVGLNLIGLAMVCFGIVWLKKN